MIITKLNKTTKRASNFISSYNYSSNYDILEAYKNCSGDKIRAWKQCKKLCYENNGHDLKVLGHNSFYFSAGFIAVNDLYIITACNYFIIPDFKN